MISLLEQLRQPLNGDLDKEASAFQQKERDLSDAPNEDFACVIYDGQSMHRKFPVKTAEDVELSKQALRRSGSELPKEIVETARHFINSASRRFKKEASFEEEGDPPATNVVYTKNIDKTAYKEKLAKKKVQHSKEAKVEGLRFSVPDKKSLREVERQFEVGLEVGPKKEAKAARDLIKKANEMGAEVRSKQVQRYGRTTAPKSFTDEVEFRKMAAPDRLEEYYEELKKEAAHVGTKDGMSLMEAAECLHILDKQADFKRPGGMSKLGKNAKSAFEVAFPLEKEADEEGESFDKVAEVFGESFAESYSENPKEAAQSLSPSERKVLQDVK